MTDTKTAIDLLVHGASEVATPEGNAARAGATFGPLRIVEGAAIAIQDGRIVEVGTEADLLHRFEPATTLDAQGGTVVPGLIDAHTHPVFDGTREGEFEQRLAGASYVDIAAAGGGIASSLRGVRDASREVLVANLMVRLDRFLALGTTTVEAKSGYGLSLEDELKCLEVIAEANRLHPVDLVPTFLGAHDVPPEFRGRKDEYVQLVVDEMLPAVAERGLARYCDVFTEAHTFDLDDTRRVMHAARDLGFGLRLHVDQLTSFGGAELAAELGAASADHLEHVTPAGIEALADANVVPVLCPVVPLFLRETQEAPGRAMVQGGLAPALATDFNPGSCYLQSLFEVLSWGALRYGFGPGEALTAATLNAAASLDRADTVGTLEPGKVADLVVTDLPNHRHLVYELGRSPVRTVVKAGQVVYDASQPMR